MNLSFENHCVSNSPSKLEGVAGEYVTSFDSYHTPQSLRDSSSILEEQPDIQPFIFVELTLNNTPLQFYFLNKATSVKIEAPHEIGGWHTFFPCQLEA